MDRLRNTASEVKSGPIRSSPCPSQSKIAFAEQFCESGRLLTRPDFRKRPDPDSDLNKFLAKFLQEIFLVEICSNMSSHEPGT
jgi:hypothetical protein